MARKLYTDTSTGLYYSGRAVGAVVFYASTSHVHSLTVLSVLTCIPTVELTKIIFLYGAFRDPSPAIKEYVHYAYVLHAQYTHNCTYYIHKTQASDKELGVIG